MTSDEFRHWRKRQGLKQKDAAELLGLKKRVIQYYEKGRRDGKVVGIPKTVELACFAISLGVRSFDGSDAALMNNADIAAAHSDLQEILPDPPDGKSVAAG